MTLGANTSNFDMVDFCVHGTLSQKPRNMEQKYLSMKMFYGHFAMRKAQVVAPICDHEISWT